MSDSSYSSTAPKPLHPGQAPRGLLKENRIGVSAGAAVAQCEHVWLSEKRRRSPFSSATATPSPSLNAVATASASRPRFPSEAGSRSTTTSTSSAPRTRRSTSASSRRTSAPSSCARTNPAARSWAASSTSWRWALGGRGKATTIAHGGLGTPDWAALALGVQRVEGERALPRPRRAGDHRERAAWQLHGDALEVVLSRIADDDPLGGRRHNR